MFIIRFRLMVVEDIREHDGVIQPIWSPTTEAAKRFDTREEAEAVVRQYQDGTMMQGAEVVPVES
jgi:hypothetical protein